MSGLTWDPMALHRGLIGMANLVEPTGPLAGSAVLVRMHPRTIMDLRRLEYMEAPRLPTIASIEDYDPTESIPSPTIQRVVSKLNAEHGMGTLFRRWPLLADRDMRPGHWRIEVMGVHGQRVDPHG